MVLGGEERLRSQRPGPQRGIFFQGYNVSFGATCISFSSVVLPPPVYPAPFAPPWSCTERNTLAVGSYHKNPLPPMLWVPLHPPSLVQEKDQFVSFYIS